MTFELPKLPYAYDALETMGMSKETLEYHKEKWTSFIQRYEVISKSCELFDTTGYKCKIRSHGKDNKLLLCRSSEMEESLIKEARLVEQDFELGGNYLNHQNKHKLNTV